MKNGKIFQYLFKLPRFWGELSFCTNIITWSLSSDLPPSPEVDGCEKLKTKLNNCIKSTTVKDQSIFRRSSASKRFKLEIQGVCSYSRKRPEKFENATLFLQLGPTYTLICHKNGAVFENALQNGGIWKRRLFVSLQARKTFWKQSFSKTMRHVS